MKAWLKMARSSFERKGCSFLASPVWEKVFSCCCLLYCQFRKIMYCHWLVVSFNNKVLLWESITWLHPCTWHNSLFCTFKNILAKLYIQHKNGMEKKIPRSSCKDAWVRLNVVCCKLVLKWNFSPIHKIDKTYFAFIRCTLQMQMIAW